MAGQNEGRVLLFGGEEKEMGKRPASFPFRNGQRSSRKRESNFVKSLKLHFGPFLVAITNQLRMKRGQDGNIINPVPSLFSIICKRKKKISYESYLPSMPAIMTVF